MAELDASEVDRLGSAVSDDATRLYERVGFRPFYRQLLGEV